MRNIVLAALLLSAFAFAEAPTYTTKDYKQDFPKGFKYDPEAMAAFQKRTRKFAAPKAVAIPGKWDLSAKVSPPENQGNHGTCWDFGITKAARSEYMLYGQDPGQLSFNWLICGGRTQYNCDSGGDFDAMNTMLNGKGPWVSAQDPYPNCSGKCVQGGQLPVAVTFDEVVTVGNGSSKPSFKDLAAALTADVLGHVLVIDVAVCGALQNYSAGIFNNNQCGANSINHIINAVGYNCETSVDSSGNCSFNANGQPVNGDGYLLVMNNWGTTWGEAGYMRIRWGVDAIANDAAYFKKNWPKPPPGPGPGPSPTPGGGPSVALILIMIGILLIGGIIGWIISREQYY